MVVMVANKRRDEITEAIIRLPKMEEKRKYINTFNYEFGNIRVNISMREMEYDNMIHVPKKYKNIVGFPTLHMMKGGKVIAEYNGARDLEDLSKFVQNYI